MHIKRRHTGLTFIETLVTLVVNITLLTGLIAIIGANFRHYNISTNNNLLNQQLETALQLMINDIRRAGYSANAANDISTGLNTNLFMVTGTTDITVNSANNCILFTYDSTKSGTLPAINTASDDKRYGFRLNNQTLQTRPPGATFDCNAAATAWEPITDPSVVNITNLTFTLSTTTVPPGGILKTAKLRSVDISLTGQLKSSPTITKTMTAHVRIRNDKFSP